jgi:hypothetical protein
MLFSFHCFISNTCTYVVVFLLFYQQYFYAGCSLSTVLPAIGKRATCVKVLLVKQWKENNLRKSIAGKIVEREQPGYKYC